jgi:arsenate reductase
MSTRRRSILFLCTGNSARSLLAEAIANQRFGAHLVARSAGSSPRGEPHPLAVATLERHGLDPSGLRSESWDRYRDERFDLVVTLCDSAARETCPPFPGAPARAHWGFADPPAADDPAACFESVFHGLVEAIGRFVAGAGSAYDPGPAISHAQPHRPSDDGPREA